MDNDGIGIIMDYKYLVGEKQGRIYRRRFESIPQFVEWCEEYDNTGLVEIINTKVVDSSRVYWDDRWIKSAAQ